MKNFSNNTDAYYPMGITELGKNALDAIRKKPVRRVKGGCSNVNVRFASSKMGCVIQAESRTVEYLFVLACEMDDEIIEYWDQPLKIKLSYRDANGRNRAHLHTPDFCVVTQDRVELIECKSQSQLLKLSKKNPEKFCKDSNGQWISPAGESAAQKYGYEYKIYTPQSFSAVFARNTEFLYDYLISDIPDKFKLEITKIQKIIGAEKIIKLKKLLLLLKNKDVVYYAIAKKIIFFDWFNDLVVRPETANVYDSHLTKFVSTKSSSFSITSEVTSHLITLRPGDKFSWNESYWTILNISNVITIQDQELNVIDIKKEDLIKLTTSGNIQLADEQNTKNDFLKNILLETSSEELEIALSRLDKLKNIKNKNRSRTIRRWHKMFKDAENSCGIGLLGLLPKTKNRGNKAPRLSENEVDLIIASIKKDYEKSSPNSAYGAYANYHSYCAKNHIIPVSYVTYLNIIKNRDQYNLIKQRYGLKAAYQIKNQHKLPELGDKIELPPQGDRAFEVAHIDHTQLEIELVSSLTGEALGRPWLTTFIDGYSRIVLAYWLTYEPPSSRSVMMVIRRCVERFNRLPQKIVLDRGAEFQSTYLETLLAAYFVTKIDRTASEPRDGSVVERYFLTTQTKFIHMLTGNTSNRRLARGLSQSHEPSNLAIWTPDAFEQRLKEWLYEIYPMLPHKGIGDKPGNLFKRSLKESGEREFRRILYDEFFYITTLPAVKGNTRKIHNGQISISNLSYVGLTKPLGPYNGNKFKVRIDPYNIKYAWIYLNNQWTKLICNHYLVREYTERNLKMAHMDVIARISNSNKEYRNVPQQLIAFLSDLRAQEKLLMNKDAQETPEQQELLIFQNESEILTENVDTTQFAVSYIAR